MDDFSEDHWGFIVVPTDVVFRSPALQCRGLGDEGFAICWRLWCSSDDDGAIRETNANALVSLIHDRYPWDSFQLAMFQ